MSHFPLILLRILLLFYLFSLSEAIVSSVTETSSGTFGTWVQKKVGLAINGIVNIDYDISLKDNTLSYESYILILVISEDQRVGYYTNLDKSDSTISSNINSLCTAPSMHRKILTTAPLSGSYNFTVNYNNGATDIYSVALLQCRSGYSSNPVRAHVQVTTKNPAPRGDSYNQLPIDLVMLVRLYLGEIFVYSLLLLGIIGQIILAK